MIDATVKKAARALEHEAKKAAIISKKRAKQAAIASLVAAAHDVAEAERPVLVATAKRRAVVADAAARAATAAAALAGGSYNPETHWFTLDAPQGPKDPAILKTVQGRVQAARSRPMKEDDAAAVQAPAQGVTVKGPRRTNMAEPTLVPKMEKQEEVPSRRPISIEEDINSVKDVAKMAIVQGLPTMKNRAIFEVKSTGVKL